MKNLVFLLAVLWMAQPIAFSQTAAELGAALGKPVPLSPDSPKASSIDDYDVSFRDIAKELRCPTCTGLSVLESDAAFSVQIKNQVKEQMQLGKNKTEVINYFVDRYGPWIMREPPKQGFNLLAWIVPIALLCLGPVAIWLLVWRRRVHVNTLGVRANEPIIAEMHERLAQLKKGE